MSETLFERVTKWDLRFLAMCKFISKWSKDPSTQIGSVIIHDVNKFVSLGYNGFASGVFDDHRMLSDRSEKYPRVIHGEVNAILFAQRNLKDHTIYVFPLPPCSPCASIIAQTGINRVVSVIPSDLERRKRWEESNAMSADTFTKKGIKFHTYDESLVDSEFRSYYNGE